ncbi:MAG: hypothetical protein SFZ02_03765 [bacterium]|nr:hypothetical protein [bacterium]
MLGKHFTITIFIGLMLVSFSTQTQVVAQQTLPPINCGDIIEVETTPERPLAEFQIQTSAGTTLNGRVEPIGTTLDISISLYDSGENYFWGSNRTGEGEIELIDSLVISTSNPALAIGMIYEGRDDVRYYRENVVGYGAFTIYLGCILRDGTVINPGDNIEESDNSSSDKPFSGIGFPGLPPVDFTNGITIPFMMDVPNSGAINPGFESVFGFTVDAIAGDKLDLTFTRLSGNLNLGLAVMSPDNKIVYQASLVTVERISALFSFPTDGQYTIGVWKIELALPATPENTAFQLVGTLNP